MQPVIICSHEEREDARTLASLLSCEAIIVSGVPLRKVCAVLERCHLFIGNDSGSAHLAGAMNCKAIVISRHPAGGDPNHANSPIRFAPYCDRVRVLQPHAGLDACIAACLSSKPHCITAVTVEQAVAAAREMLAKDAPSAAWTKMAPPLWRRFASFARFSCGSCSQEGGGAFQGYGEQVCEAAVNRNLTMFPLRLPQSRYGRIVKAVSSGAAARLVSAGLTLLSLPLAVRYLGAERYGVWVTITTTVVWINLLDLGIANTLTNSISRAYALDDKRSAARYFTNALLVTASIAAIAGGAFAVVCSRVNWMKLFNVSANVSAAEVRDTVAVAAALMLLGLPCNLGGKLLAGYQELHRNNYAVCVGAVASVVGLALGVALRVSMPVLFVMSVGCLTFASLANLIFVVMWSKPWLVPRASD